MDVTAALYKAIFKKALSTEGGSLTRIMDEIQRSAGGSPGRAAKLAGVPPRTWRAWRGGRRPRPERIDALRAVQRRLRLPAGREQWLRGTPAVAVWAEVQISDDIRERVLRISTWPDDSLTQETLRFGGIVGRVLDRFLAGDDDAVEDTFLAPIRHHLGQQGVSLNHVYEIKLYQRESEAESWSRSVMMGKR